MNMCSINGATIVVVIVASLMVFVSLVYYFNSRIINLEKTIVRQNHVLTDFIANVKNNAMLSRGEEIVPQEIIEPHHCSEKIGVSDSENSSHTCDSESSSKFDDTEHNIEITPIDKTEITHLSQQQILHSPIFEICTDHPTQTVKLGDLETVEQLDNLSASSGPISHDENESCTLTSTCNSVDFKKMKLTQLKDIASSKGIDVKGKKKTELVETLNSQ
jgi:hypothetical protein